MLVQGHECLCNLQHKDYNNLVKDSSWKETAGYWQGKGMVCVNRPLTQRGNGMGTACVNRP
jgi:hypothetical protein